MDVYQRIVTNLKDRAYPVSLPCALKGVDDWAEGLAALQTLVANNRVVVEHLSSDPTNTCLLYRLSWQATAEPKIRRSEMHVVDSTE